MQEFQPCITLVERFSTLQTWLWVFKNPWKYCKIMKILHKNESILGNCRQENVNFCESTVQTCACICADLYLNYVLWWSTLKSISGFYLRSILSFFVHNSYNIFILQILLDQGFSSKNQDVLVIFFFKDIHGWYRCQIPHQWMWCRGPQLFSFL